MRNSRTHATRIFVGMLISATFAFAACDDDEAPPQPSPTTTAEAAVAPAASFEGTRCLFQLPEGQRGEDVECGYLTVPENRANPNGRTIRLAVAVLKTTHRDPAPDPILYLSGGPGGPSLEGEMQSWTASFAAPFQLQRDIVFYDQRGTGLSQPSLRCPEVRSAFLAALGQRLTPFEEEEGARAAALTCRGRLLQVGVDLSAYNSAESAADIRELRIALGYDEWNLFGVSYGTRLALTVMRDHPEGIRSVVLDSTVPLQVQIDAEQARNFQNVLELMFRDCAADPPCNRAYPDLRETVTRLITDLDEAPVTVTPTDEAGNPLPIVVTGHRLVAGAFQVFYATSLIPLVPTAAYQIDEGNFALLTALAGGIVSVGANTSQGMTLSVDCAESLVFTTEDDVIAGTDGVLDELIASSIGTTTVDEWAKDQTFCEAWGAEQRPAIEAEPVSSDIPALILGGEYDPITPPRYGEMAGETLSNSFFFEFPATGHGVIFGRHTCASGIVMQWLNEVSSAPDASCIEAIGPPSFQLP